MEFRSSVNITIDSQDHYVVDIYIYEPEQGKGSIKEHRHNEFMSKAAASAYIRHLYGSEECEIRPAEYSDLTAPSPIKTIIW